jgi:hypothetical protein
LCGLVRLRLSHSARDGSLGVCDGTPVSRPQFERQFGEVGNRSSRENFTDAWRHIASRVLKRLSISPGFRTILSTTRGIDGMDGALLRRK